jgi:hypothetical protein
MAAILGLAIWAGPQLRGSEMPVTLTDLNSTAQIYCQCDTGIGSWAVNGTNQIARQWFWYSVGTVGASNPEQAFNSLFCTFDRPSTTYVSNDTLTQDFTQSGQFDISLTYLLHGASSTVSNMTVQITVTNLQSQALNFNLFQLANFDLGGSSGLDTAQASVNQGLYTNFAEYNQSTTLDLTASPGATRAQVGADPTIYNCLSGPQGGDLNDSVGPTGPANVDSALQWDLNVAGNGTSTVTVDESLTVGVVPEPATLCLLVLGGLGVLRRKKN